MEQDDDVFTTCTMCQAPVTRGNYQHMGGYFFCGSEKDCLTTWLGVQHVQDIPHVGN